MSFQICFYFQLTFHNLNVKAKKLLNSKKNPKIKACKVYLLIKQHNDICLMLKRFNDFWKFHLLNSMSFYVILIWFCVYISIFYSKLDFFGKLFMNCLPAEVVCILAFIVLIIILVSIQVNINYKLHDEFEFD